MFVVLFVFPVICFPKKFSGRKEIHPICLNRMPATFLEGAATKFSIAMIAGRRGN
jgi:hypothetical protein